MKINVGCLLLFEDFLGKYVKIVYKDNDKIFWKQGKLKEEKKSFLFLTLNDGSDFMVKIDNVERIEEVIM